MSKKNEAISKFVNTLIKHYEAKGEGFEPLISDLTGINDNIDQVNLDNILGTLHNVIKDYLPTEDVSSNDMSILPDDDLNNMKDTWLKFGQKPSKISVYFDYEAEGFNEMLTDIYDIEESDINKITEIIPTTDGQYLTNSKKLIRLSDYLYISFIEHENMDMVIVSNLILYYNNEVLGNEKVLELINQLNAFIISPEEETRGSNIEIIEVNVNTNALDTSPINIEVNDDNDFFDYYESNIMKEYNNLLKSHNKNNNILSIIHGIRGTGKSTFLKYLINNLNKKVILIPFNMIDSIINSFDFIDIIKANKNSVFVLEDVDGLINPNISLNTFVNTIESISSDSWDVNFIVTLNNNQIYQPLKESKRLESIIKFDKLSIKMVHEIVEKHGIKGKFDRPMTISEIFNSKKMKKRKSNSNYL